MMRAGRFGGSSKLQGRTSTGGRFGGSSSFGAQGGSPPILSNFVDDLELATPAAYFDATNIGNATVAVWDFHSSITPPTPGAGNLGTGTFAIVEGANSATIDLSSSPGTGYVHITVTSSYGTSNVLTSQQISVGFVDPRDIPNAYWFDGSDVTTLHTNTEGTTQVSATNDLVKSWAPKLGSGTTANVLNDEATNWPYWNSGGYVVFDGSNDGLWTNVALHGGLYAAGALSVFALATIPTGQVNKTLFSEADTANLSGWYNFRTGGSGAETTAVMRIFNNAGTAEVDAAVSAANFFNNTKRVIGVIDSGTAITSYIGTTAYGSPVSYTRSGTHTPNRFGIGHQQRGLGNENPMQMNLYQFVVVPRVLTTQEISDLVTYLNTK